MAVDGEIEAAGLRVDEAKVLRRVCLGKEEEGFCKNEERI